MLGLDENSNFFRAFFKIAYFPLLISTKLEKTEENYLRVLIVSIYLLVTIIIVNNKCDLNLQGVSEEP